MRIAKRYSLFSRKRGSRFWTQRSSVELPKESAIRFFQDLLIGGAFDPEREWRLRPVKRKH